MEGQRKKRKQVLIAIPVRQSIPVSLSDKLESVQRLALKIIYPAESYNTALQRAQIADLPDATNCVSNILWTKSDLTDTLYTICYPGGLTPIAPVA